MYKSQMFDVQRVAILIKQLKLVCLNKVYQTNSVIQSSISSPLKFKFLMILNFLFNFV